MTAIDWLVDIVIALGAFGFGLLQITVSANLFIPDDFIRRILGVSAVAPNMLAIIAMLLTCLPLVIRRRFPWPVLVLTLSLWAIFEIELQAISLSLIGPLVALFTVACECSRTQAFIAGTATAIVAIAWPVTNVSSALTSLMMVQNVVLIAAVDLAGYAIHTRQDYIETAEARAAEAELNREVEAQKRVEEERVRIAREVHDITAHSLSAVSIQAAAAERLVYSDPAAAQEAIANVRELAKRSLDEMRGVIGVLRSGAVAETEPTQGTEHFPELQQYLQQAGVECTLKTAAYDVQQVPVFIDVALFGIAREAATNIVRHAGATRAVIALSSSDGYAMLAVEDNGVGMGSVSVADTNGHGIEGMAERVNVLGGTFSLTEGPLKGTKIEAIVPLSSVQAK